MKFKQQHILCTPHTYTYTYTQKEKRAVRNEQKIRVTNQPARKQANRNNRQSTGAAAAAAGKTATRNLHPQDRQLDWGIGDCVMLCLM